MNRTLPKIETPEVAKEKMKQAHSSFIDSCSKFISVADFYLQDENRGRRLPDDFIETYSRNLLKLKECTPDDFVYLMASPCALSLSFIDDMKENLMNYDEILKGQDESLSDYDKACDLLAIRDTFTDLENDLNEVNAIIVSNLSVDSHPNNRYYDLQKATALKINPEE